VIAYEQPVYFVRGESTQLLRVRRPFWLAIGDTGIASPTRVAVGAVRRGWTANPKKYDALFDGIGAVAAAAKGVLSSGSIAALGRLMDENQALLQALGVSSPELNRLIAAAREAGASGAKLCGAGRGGNMIAVASEPRASEVAEALRRAGAVGVIVTQVGGAAADR
jgi:mevalonate kinase